MSSYYDTGATRLARDHYRETQRLYRVRQAQLARLMRAKGWRWHRTLGFWVPQVTP